MASKGIIYYTDSQIQDPIRSTVQKYIKESGLPITSVSLYPKQGNFGDRDITLILEPCFMTYLTQIEFALETSKEDYVFFCEHDVLYPKSHFDFMPPKDDVFYYNSNVWRWLYGSETAITYDRLISLSGLCVNREFALDHYRRRIDKAIMFPRESNVREPSWARLWGYEPGTKKRDRGGFSDDDFETWSSEQPIVDIRHKGTISKDKVTLDSFKHQPTNWKEIPVSEIPGWNIKEVFT